MDIFSIIILFFVISTVFRLIKRISQPAKQAQQQPMTQGQIEATQPKPIPKPAPKPADFRFPPVQKTAPKPVFQQGRDPNAVVNSDLSQYKPITPSSDLDIRFSNYKGSLDTTGAEGIGYKPEAYDNVSAAYQSDTRIDAKILPEAFNRNALIQAVVMSEILKRPGTSRR